MDMLVLCYVSKKLRIIFKESFKHFQKHFLFLKRCEPCGSFFANHNCLTDEDCDGTLNYEWTWIGEGNWTRFYRTDSMEIDWMNLSHIDEEKRSLSIDISLNGAIFPDWYPGMVPYCTMNFMLEFSLTDQCLDIRCQESGNTLLFHPNGIANASLIKGPILPHHKTLLLLDPCRIFPRHVRNV